MDKYQKLLDFLGQYQRLAIAFSGGVDSSLLVYAASKLAQTSTLAITATSELVPKLELEFAKNFAAKCKVEHILVYPDPLSDQQVRNNPPERCYYCKKIIIGAIRKITHERGIETIIEGSNLDDGNDYRPGATAVREAGLVSPLVECGFTKEDIRQVSRSLGVDGWERPACACLASRIPYRTCLEPAILRRIEKAEAGLAQLGFIGARVRAHGAVARIEVAPDKIPEAAAKHTQLLSIIRAAGFDYAALDLQGYRTGSLNETL